MTTFVLGSLVEVIGKLEVGSLQTTKLESLLTKGYSTRLTLYSNPWNQNGFVELLAHET